MGCTTAFIKISSFAQLLFSEAVYISFDFCMTFIIPSFSFDMFSKRK